MAKFPITDTVTIKHMIRTGNKEAPNTSNDYMDVDATITPNGMFIQNSEGVPAFQLFDIFIWDTTVEVANGDRVINQDNQEWIVAGSPNVVKRHFPNLLFIQCVGRQVV